MPTGHDLTASCGAPALRAVAVSQSDYVIFLLETTWLAVSVWVSEHGHLVGAVALAGLQRRQLTRETVRA